MDDFVRSDDVRNLTINIVAAVIFAITTGLFAQLLRLNQLNSLIFILLVGLVGGLLGWWFHYRRTQKMVRAYIGNYDKDFKFLASSKKIRMIAITFGSFFPYRNYIQQAIFNHDAEVKILLLNPQCRNFREFAKQPEENFERLKGESPNAINLIEALKSEIQNENKLRGLQNRRQIHGSIEYKFFNSFPYRGCILTDTVVRYWPFLYHRNPSGAPVYHIAHKSKIAEALENEFEKIWMTAHQRQQNFWTIEKIVSGGQTGADRAALDWAISHEIPHGGWCPKGRQAEDGSLNPQYQLRETTSPDPAVRTRKNVQDSDGTIIFSIKPELTEGSLLTLDSAAKIGKPCLHLYREDSNSDHSARLLTFLPEYEIKTLNVAGPRASTESEIVAFVTDILEGAFILAQDK